LSDERLDDFYTEENFRKSFEVLKSVLAKLDERGIDYVLIGGWAMRAYDSPIGSVDIDLLIQNRDEGTVEEIITGLASDREFRVSVDYEILEGRNALWSTDFKWYVPAELLEDSAEKRGFKYGSSTIVACVPDIESLFFMKPKAYRDRNLQYDCKTNFADYQKIGVIWQRELGRYPEQYLLRKAGKDLADLSILLGHGLSVSRDS